MSRKKIVLLPASILAAAVVTLSQACEGPTGYCTTKAACVDGLLVRLDQLPVGAFSVSITPVPPDFGAPGAPVFRYDCAAGGAPCLKDVFFGGYLSGTAYVELITALGSEVHRIDGIQYTWKHPNGEGCDGSCQSGVIDLAIPQ